MMGSDLLDILVPVATVVAAIAGAAAAYLAGAALKDRGQRKREEGLARPARARQAAPRRSGARDGRGVHMR